MSPTTMSSWTNQPDQFVNVVRAHGNCASLKVSMQSAARNDGQPSRRTAAVGTRLPSCPLVSDGIVVVSNRLAHERAFTTLNVYAHAVPGGVRDAAQLLESRLLS